jgi:hypothetical protein
MWDVSSSFTTGKFAVLHFDVIKFKFSADSVWNRKCALGTQIENGHRWAPKSKMGTGIENGHPNRKWAPVGTQIENGHQNRNPILSLNL